MHVSVSRPTSGGACASTARASMLRPRVDGTSFHKTTKTEKAKQLVRSVVQGSHFALGSQILHSTQLASHYGASVRTSSPPKPLRSFHYPLSRYASECKCSTRHPEARVMCMLNSDAFLIKFSFSIMAVVRRESIHWLGSVLRFQVHRASLLLPHGLLRFKCIAGTGTMFHALTSAIRVTSLLSRHQNEPHKHKTPLCRSRGWEERQVQHGTTQRSGLGREYQTH